jgi:hypothetical protein
VTHNLKAEVWAKKLKDEYEKTGLVYGMQARCLVMAVV